MPIVALLALLLIVACGARAPQIPQSGEAPGFIRHYPATGHLVG